MKKYMLSLGRTVNKKASNSGIKFVYKGKTDEDPQEIAERYRNDYIETKENAPDILPAICAGIRIKDAETKQIVYEEIFQ